MRPIVILVFMIILYITKPAIADRIPRNCNALDYNQLRKSCSVCQNLFLMQKNSFQVYRIRAACLTLAKNGCCKNFRLVKISDLNIMEKMKKLRHFSHGFDIIWLFSLLFFNDILLSRPLLHWANILMAGHLK